MFYFYIKDLTKLHLGSDTEFTVLPAPIWNAMNNMNFKIYWDEWWGLTKERLRWVM